MRHMTFIIRILRTSVWVFLSLHSLASFAQENRLESLMQTYGLTEFDLTQLPLLQFFDNPYVVSKRGDELVVSHSWPGRAKDLQVGEQSYLWENRGEFGGKLRFRSTGGVVDVMAGNIVDLLKIGDEIFVISGLAHLGMSSGAVHKISDPKEPTSAAYITRLPDAPILVYLDDDRKDYLRKVFVGNKSVMSLDPDNSVNVLYWDAFWAFGLTPTSVVRYEDYYLIGLPHGIATVPAPFGPASQYCRKDSAYLPPNSCTRVRFYADETFRSEIERKAPIYARPKE